MTTENITLRKPRNPSDSLNHSQESFTSVMSGLRTSSLPDLTENQNDIEEMKIQIQQLQDQLKSADNEIIRLTQQNTSLSNQVKMQENTINSLKRNENKAPKTKNKKRKKSGNMQKGSPSTSLDSNAMENTPTHSTPQKVKEKQTQPSSVSKTKINIKNKSSILSNKNKKKLCIVSSNNKNNILKILEEIELNKEYKCCHYIYTGGGSKQLISGLDSKLEGYTKKDFCVIMLGESDFKQSQQYTALVYEIAEYLKQITHTNIIIALPTYVCGSIIYNCRVEMFNALLAMDAWRNQYAEVFDSNSDLTLDMFSNLTGKIKDNGIKNIMENIKKLIHRYTWKNIETDTHTPNTHHPNNCNLSNDHENNRKSNQEQDFFRI